MPGRILIDNRKKNTAKLSDLSFKFLTDTFYTKKV